MFSTTLTSPNVPLLTCLIFTVLSSSPDSQFTYRGFIVSSILIWYARMGPWICFFRLMIFYDLLIRDPVIHISILIPRLSASLDRALVYSFICNECWILIYLVFTWTSQIGTSESVVLRLNSDVKIVELSKREAHWWRGRGPPSRHLGRQLQQTL